MYFFESCKQQASSGKQIKSCSLRAVRCALFAAHTHNQELLSIYIFFLKRKEHKGRKVPQRSTLITHYSFLTVARLSLFAAFCLLLTAYC
jgi:hypothetical protein